MKIDITGNPGTGNTFNDIHIDINKVENLNPNATTVNNYYYGTHEDRTMNHKQKEEIIDTSVQREEILRYVYRLKEYITDDWKQCYDNLWNDILNINEVQKELYNPGKQQGTNFNRNLVANIIHYLGMRGMFKDYNAAQITTLLEGDKDHSVRRALGKEPTSEIANRIKSVIQHHKK